MAQITSPVAAGRSDTKAAAPEARPQSNGGELLGNLKPLVVDVALPVGSYYLLHKGLGLDLITSLALSSVVPAVRAIADAVRHRTFNGLAGLMLLVNVAGIALSFVTGDARLMLAKDSGVSSVIGLSIIVMALRGRFLMSAGLKPFMTKGDAAKIAAWDRLSAGSAAFGRLERRFSLVWGGALLGECVARLIGAFTLPVETMAWLSSVMLIGAIAVGIAVGAVATQPIEKMIEAEAAAAA
ncbi:VC0807 family protein [Actinoallomurus sp. NPDC050550]|uniref:VC0807 family protein n=1 Tax=Actinoallomurus sp. NPDC050550 TaxID=3154937 RepID=UPI0033ED4763